MRVILSRSLKGVIGSRESFLNRSNFKLCYASNASEFVKVLRFGHCDFAVLTTDMAGLEESGIRRELATLLTDKKVKYLLVARGGQIPSCDDPLIQNCSRLLSAALSEEEILEWFEGQIGVSARSHIRARISVDVKCGYPFHTSTGEIRNLSEGGILLESNARLHLGSVLRLDFALPEVGYFITALGRIVWSMAEGREGRQRYGVEFLDINRDDQKMIKLYVKHRALG